MQFGVAHLAAKVFDMHAVVGEESIMGQLVGFGWEEFIDFIGTAELFLDLCAHFLPVLQPTFTQEAANRQVHRVVGGDHVHAPKVDFLVQQPFADAVMRTWMAVDEAISANTPMKSNSGVRI